MAWAWWQNLGIARAARAQRALQAKRQASPAHEDGLGAFLYDGNRWSTMRGDVRISVYNVDRDALPAILDRHRAFVVATLTNDEPLRQTAAARTNRDAATLAPLLVLQSIRLPTDASQSIFLLFRAPDDIGGQAISLAIDP